MFAEFDGSFFLFHANIKYSIVNFVSAHPLKSTVSVVAVCAYSLLLALFTQYLSTRVKGLGQLMYGPLAPLLSKQETDLITCFVLTKKSNGDKSMMYAGFPVEISLKGTNTIDHIVIRDPEKFYLKMDKTAPISTFSESRSIASSYSQSFLYLSCEEIENVHFEGFYFEL